MSSSHSRSPKLRTKAGCVTCRTRRKKCDQGKPICATCDRLCLDCEYPDRDSLEDRRERRAPNSRWSPKSKSPETSPSSQCSPLSTTTLDAIPMSQQEPSQSSSIVTIKTSYFGILSTAQIFLRSSREILLLSSYCDFFVPANILPNAHANFSKLYVGEVQELKDSMFACSSMQLSNKHDAPPVEALDYYTRAVSGLRRKLSAKELTGREDWLLLTTILLHCFETWRCDADQSTPMAFQHLLGAIQLLKLRCQSPLTEEGHYDLYILMAESIIFHVSTLLVSSPSFAALEIDSNLWEWIEIILQKPAYEDLPPPASHPVLGTPRQLNKLVFEISKLSMRAPLTAGDVLDLEKLGNDLTKWEIDEEALAYDHRPDLSEDPYSKVRNLYIVCARILLLTIEATGENSEVVVREQHVRKYITKALEIIHEMENTSLESWNFLMRWPLRVLGCIVESEEDKNVIRAALENIWTTSACGDVKRSLDKIDRLSEPKVAFVTETCATKDFRTREI
ncbi:hypothetical protein BKA65DRAFT_116714 [Rhexocercosporidium sp. MPI-PUGE-AT-0058]|nr:hypothetical protein BKA65DRAFT_116714 [Rhexocercosporidium sp. MPI-PUGE-AT-0058]